MFIRKNNIIYNLDHYAKVYPHKDSKTLCLANVQGDFDEIKFATAEEAVNAFNIITNHFIPPMGITPDQLPNMINFDDLGRSFRVDAEGNLRTEISEEDIDRIVRQNREQGWRAAPSRPWDDPLEQAGERPADPPEEEWTEEDLEVEQEADTEEDHATQPPFEWNQEDHLVMNGNLDQHVEFAPEMEDAIRGVMQSSIDEQSALSHNLQNQIYENNQFVEEQVDRLERRNEDLERQLSQIRDELYNRLMRRDEENVETIL